MYLLTVCGDGGEAVIKKSLIGVVTRLQMTNFISRDAGQHASAALANGNGSV